MIVGSSISAAVLDSVGVGYAEGESLLKPVIEVLFRY